jgi:hypothetical protein
LPKENGNKGDLIMIKPLSVKRQEFVENLVNLVNSADLPPFVMEPILNDVHASVRNLIKEQYKREKELYDTFLAESEKEGE